MGAPYKPCSACKVGRTRGRLCAPCLAAAKDKESAWDLGKGEWVQRGSRRIWVGAEPATLDDEAGQRKCAHCGERFTPKRRQIYCGQKCKSAAENERRKARKTAAG